MIGTMKNDERESIVLVKSKSRRTRGALELLLVSMVACASGCTSQQARQNELYDTGQPTRAQPASSRAQPAQSEPDQQQPARRPNVARGILNIINPLGFEIPGSEPADLFPGLMNNPAYREERRKRGLE